MRSFILSLALVFVTAEARRDRSSGFDVKTLPKKPKGLDTKVVGRRGKPSGFEAVTKEQEKH